MAIPIALLVDDSTPFAHLYRHHLKDISRRPIATADGIELGETVPHDFLENFCNVVGEQGMAGKFSIVPAPMGRGDVVRGIEGHGPERTRAWLGTARNRLGKRFDFSPEMLTHSWAVDIGNGNLLLENEDVWSQHQDRVTLTPYIARALTLLKDAGIEATGVTSPWMFGEKVEEEYIAAIAAAMRKVNKRDFSWYFLHIKQDPTLKPWVAYRKGRTTVVSIASGLDDLLWDTIWRHGKMDEPQIRRQADVFLSERGGRGKIRDVIDAGGWPILLVHWQTIYSNGLETGLRILEEVGRRVKGGLGDAVEWMSCMEMARRTVEEAGKED